MEMTPASPSHGAGAVELLPASPPHSTAPASPTAGRRRRRAAGAGGGGRRATGPAPQGSTLDIEVDPDLLLAAEPARCRVEVRAVVAGGINLARGMLVPFGTAVRVLVSTLPGQSPLSTGARCYSFSSPASRGPQQWGRGAGGSENFFLAVSLSLTEEQLAAMAAQQAGLFLPLPGWGVAQLLVAAQPQRRAVRVFNVPRDWQPDLLRTVLGGHPALPVLEVIPVVDALTGLPRQGAMDVLLGPAAGQARQQPRNIRLWGRRGEKAPERLLEVRPLSSLPPPVRRVQPAANPGPVPAAGSYAAAAAAAGPL